MEIVIVILLIVIFCQWMIPKTELQDKRKKLADSTKLLQEASDMIADLGDEIAKRDSIIARNDHMWKYSEGHVESLQRQLEERDMLIVRLRRELKKRTEQYNDLVDLARERGIIGE